MKISILLPIKDFNYNLLKRCVKSIFAQSYQNFELIIKCNCVENEFLQIKNHFNNLKIILINSDDSSITEAANQAAKMVTGDIMTLFAHDDFYLQNAFQTLIDSIDDHKWYFGDINYYSNNIPTPTYYKSNVTLEDMKYNNMIPQPACFWKREIYEEIGNFDENFKLCWDYDYWIRIMCYYKPKYINFKFANYFLNSNSISIKYNNLMDIEKIKIFEKHFLK